MRLLHNNHLLNYPKPLKSVAQDVIGFSLLGKLRAVFGTTEFFDSAIPVTEFLKVHIKRSTGYIPQHILRRIF